MTQQPFTVYFTDLSGQGWDADFDNLTAAAEAAVRWRLQGGTARIYNCEGKELSA